MVALAASAVMERFNFMAVTLPMHCSSSHLSVHWHRCSCLPKWDELKFIEVNSKEMHKAYFTVQLWEQRCIIIPSITLLPEQFVHPGLMCTHKLHQTPIVQIYMAWH